ncbi:hypothetical protein DM02DRAFT_329706 [Periconia macrospinosa]|uniref:Uncharacterized protein n=1 Tax=Periconia macrospinosa TaxID=97972 RepID=A0A2V1DXJ5_9PLEO|nr:hypothetical protein DM02DRAFT_329706 [Periconia macrospinosa]
MESLFISVILSEQRLLLKTLFFWPGWQNISVHHQGESISLYEFAVVEGKVEAAEILKNFYFSKNMTDAAKNVSHLLPKTKSLLFWRYLQEKDAIDSATQSTLTMDAFQTDLTNQEVLELLDAVGCSKRIILSEAFEYRLGHPSIIGDEPETRPQLWKEALTQPSGIRPIELDSILFDLTCKIPGRPRSLHEGTFFHEATTMLQNLGACDWSAGWDIVEDISCEGIRDFIHNIRSEEHRQRFLNSSNEEGEGLLSLIHSPYGHQGVPKWGGDLESITQRTQQCETLLDAGVPVQIHDFTRFFREEYDYQSNIFRLLAGHLGEQKHEILYQCGKSSKSRYWIEPLAELERIRVLLNHGCNPLYKDSRGSSVRTYLQPRYDDWLRRNDHGIIPRYKFIYQRMLKVLDEWEYYYQHGGPVPTKKESAEWCRDLLKFNIEEDIYILHESQSPIFEDFVNEDRIARESGIGPCTMKEQKDEKVRYFVRGMPRRWSHVFDMYN